MIPTTAHFIIAQNVIKAAHPDGEFNQALLGFLIAEAIQLAEERGRTWGFDGRLNEDPDTQQFIDDWFEDAERDKEIRHGI